MERVKSWVVGLRAFVSNKVQDQTSIGLVDHARSPPGSAD